MISISNISYLKLFSVYNPPLEFNLSLPCSTFRRFQAAPSITFVIRSSKMITHVFTPSSSAEAPKNSFLNIFRFFAVINMFRLIIETLQYANQLLQTNEPVQYQCFMVFILNHFPSVKVCMTPLVEQLQVCDHGEQKNQPVENFAF